ncbi:MULTISPECIES: type IV toxin-antitoxin system AbiEi family antitoxin domain-containing protein [unclassified Actinotalea]|uniref:type IV toxin-antitoxin system AbiEi family antitoxin domain-containing protein n=1 Tax=unclassified Actinotalea TaxID=2638618 RepID=UPI0015F51CEF|nr:MULTISPECIES: type IV toxin-antitoxin system AbiEi family antitoxin domain-containing protein [unclassified Actinotalea]
MTDTLLPAELHSIAATHDGVLRRSHLLAAGLTARDITSAVRAGRVVRLYRDTYRLPAADDGPGADFLATTVAVRQRHPDRVLTGVAAVAALGLPVFGRPRHVPVVHDPRGGASARSVTRTVAPPPADQLVRLPTGLVAGPARAALDAARLDGVVAGVVAADAALRAGMTTHGELGRVLASMSGLLGVHHARRCADLASAGSASPGESWSAVVLDTYGMPRAERQVALHDERGLIGVVDFLWSGAAVVGEFDGRVKYGRTNPSGRPPEEVLWDEKVREDRLRSRGYAVVRWTTADLRAPEHWITRLRRSLGA